MTIFLQIVQRPFLDRLIILCQSLNHSPVILCQLFNHNPHTILKSMFSSPTTKFFEVICLFMCLLCFIVPCPSLTDPKNGIMNCSLGDDRILSYKDTCSFTCNTGYELTGSDTRTCQSDGNWSGSETICRGGNMKIT